MQQRLERLNFPGTLAAVLAAAVLASCAPAPAPTAPDRSAADEQQIRALLTHIEQVFDAGDLAAAIDVFAPDAIVLAQGSPDQIGQAAIREIYANALAQVNLGARFNTEEIRVVGDLAYERGTYVLTVSDKATRQVLATATSRHVHIFKRQPNGEWKTWRMMTNSATPTPPAP